MELLQLKYFCEAAESENFSHTAKKNGVPTSNISQTVKRLETELGVRLFLRSANKITLSDEGKTLYDGAKKALITLEDTVKKLRDSEDNPCGELKLLILAHRRTVTLAIEEYKLAYPNVQIIINHSSDAPYSDFDFVISDGAEDKGNYDTELLLKEKILLAVSNKSPLSKRVGLKLSDLSNENFISMSKKSKLSDLTDLFCRCSGFTPRTVISTDDPYYVRKYVDMNLGIALVPGVSWRGQFSPDTSLIDIGDLWREVYLYTHKNREPSGKEMKFIEILRRVFSAERALDK